MVLQCLSVVVIFNFNWMALLALVLFMALIKIGYDDVDQDGETKYSLPPPGSGYEELINGDLKYLFMKVPEWETENPTLDKTDLADYHFFKKDGIGIKFESKGTDATVNFILESDTDEEAWYSLQSYSTADSADTYWSWGQKSGDSNHLWFNNAKNLAEWIIKFERSGKVLNKVEETGKMLMVLEHLSSTNPNGLLIKIPPVSNSTSEFAFQVQHASNPIYRIERSGQVSGIIGSPSMPSYSFLADKDTGMYLSAENELAFATSGAERVKILPNGQTVFMASSGASMPAITFINDTNTGMYRDAADTLAFATGGSERVKILSTGQTVFKFPVKVETGDDDVAEFLSTDGVARIKVGDNFKTLTITVSGSGDTATFSGLAKYIFSNIEADSLTVESAANNLATFKSTDDIAQININDSTSSGFLQVQGSTDTMTLGGTTHFKRPLPTTDPAINGAWWNDGGTVKVSTG